jgi:hypothetical protein
MPRLALALAAAAALLGSACSKSACQELGEKLCGCQPNASSDTCKTQVQDQLNSLGVDQPGLNGILDHLAAGEPVSFDDFCQQRLDACVAAQEAAGTTNFCQFLLTAPAKDACGLTPANPLP